MKQAYETLKKSQMYQDYCQDHSEDYLVHAFLMKDSQYEEQWQFGLYNKGTDQVTSFVVKGDDIQLHESSEVMKRPEDTLKKLDVSQEYIADGKAVEIAQKYIDDNFHGKSPKSKILILQNTAEYGTIWNVTIITLTFDAVNLKLDAKTGEIKKADAHSLLDLQNQQQS